MSDVPTIMPTGTQIHVSSYGSANYMGNSGGVESALEQVWSKWPNAVVVDGNDDWYAPKDCRPPAILNDLGVSPLAWFHTGISGITKSGAVITREEYEANKEAFAKVAVYTNPERRK